MYFLKVFLILWVYYLFLAFWVLKQILVTSIGSLCTIIRVIQNSRYFSVSRGDAKLIDDFVTLGDWFILRQLKKNVYSITFHSFLHLLIGEFRLRIGKPTGKKMLGFGHRWRWHHSGHCDLVWGNI